MSNGYVSMSVAKPHKSGVYAVRYVSRNLADPDDRDGHLCEAFAYWDNGLKRWARTSFGVNIALQAKRTAAFYYRQRQDLDWKAI